MKSSVFLTCRIRFSGTEYSVKDSAKAAQAICRTHGARTFDSVYGEKEIDSLWSARKGAIFAAVAEQPQGSLIWSTDVAVPISRMADLIGKFNNQLVLQLAYNFSLRTNRRV